MRLDNYINGRWTAADAQDALDVLNPATEEVLAEVPLCGDAEVDAAARAGQAAFDSWRRTPIVDRVQPLYELKTLLERHAEELAAIVTRENGKNHAEAMGSVRRGIQMVEVAIGSPSLMMGQALEDVARGVDCTSMRQPLGVFACIAPFNFPAMVPMWFFPFAVACGNSFIVKPSEQVPLSSKMIFDLVHDCGFPEGVLNMVHGGREAVEAIVTHPMIQGVSFVGSSPVAEVVYRGAAQQGKRVQALGGAKNFIVVMPDAKMDETLDAITASAFGCCGERCLAASVILTVGDCHDEVRDGLRERMDKITVGDGSQPGIDMGPLISAPHKEKVLGLVQAGVDEGAQLLRDGREDALPDKGFFLGPCLFDEVTPEMTIAREEVFGPVLSIMRADSLDDAIAIARRHPLANASSIFTTSGAAARQFQYEIDASMVGVNIGVAAPMAMFGFGGAKGSFYGDLKAHGREAYDFYTDRKVTISRW